MDYPDILETECIDLLSLIIMVVAYYQVIWMFRICRYRTGNAGYKLLAGSALIYNFALSVLLLLAHYPADSYLLLWYTPIIIAVSSALTFFSLAIFKTAGHNVLALFAAACLLAAGSIHQHFAYLLLGNSLEPRPAAALFAAGAAVTCLLGSLLALRGLSAGKEWGKWTVAAVVALLALATRQLFDRSVVIRPWHNVMFSQKYGYTAAIFLLSMIILIIVAVNLSIVLAERKFSRLKGHYRHFIEHSTDGFALILNGKWIYLNPSFLNMLGYNEEEDLIGLSVYDFLAERHIGEVRRRIECNEECPVTLSKPVEIEWKSPNGKPLYTETILSESTGHDQQVYRIIIRDITERKQNEANMLHTEKLYVAGQLAAGIAHEIRNPLTTLKGFLQLLEEGHTPNGSYYGIMKSELLRIETVVSELLMVSKPQAAELVRSDTAVMMKETLKLLESEAVLHNIVFDLKLSGQPLWVFGVESQIKQVFINIINNAIEAMHKEGGVIRIGMDLQSDTVEIRIKDDGPGMSEEQLAKLGQPFYTTKERGTGLGLMVTFKIVYNHHGSIEATSQQGKGTVFIIKLPYCREQRDGVNKTD